MKILFNWLIIFVMIGSWACQNGNKQASETDQVLDADSTTTYTTAAVRQIMEQVWAPVQHFYDTVGVGDPDRLQLPDNLDTPEEVRQSLEQTMSPAIARKFTQQLIWKRKGKYEVRPTERIRTIQHVETTQLIISKSAENKLVVIEQYPPSELYGSQPRVNVLEKQNGHWKLVDLK